MENNIINVSEDYPASFNKQVFYGLKSFAARLKYCSDNLPKIAAGSGRVVFKIDDTTVLKLAKNPKGIAQNMQEAQIGGDHYFSGIVTAVLNFDQDDKWIESELAKKLTPTRFKELAGVDINTAGAYFIMREKENSRRSGQAPVSHSFTPEQLAELNENQFLADVVDLMFNYTIRAGDFGRLSSFGEVNREGHPMVVAIDYGLSDEVWQDHYERKPAAPAYRY